MTWWSTEPPAKEDWLETMCRVWFPVRSVWRASISPRCIISTTIFGQGFLRMRNMRNVPILRSIEWASFTQAIWSFIVLLSVSNLPWGLSLRAELVMPVFSINVGVGRNLIYSGGDMKGFYQILALKTYITRHLFLHVGYQLSKFKDPNNLMLGLGYRFHDKRWKGNLYLYTFVSYLFVSYVGDYPKIYIFIF